MSAQEERQRIIRENIPKLIHSLTKFEPSDPNFQLCEQCAWYTIRNHRNISVNSHEVKRRIDGVIEKFVIGNYPEHAEHFKRLCNELVEHPLCLKHYELDVQWAIIDFLLNVSYNPVGSIKRSHSSIEFVNFKAKEDRIENDVEYWVNLLKEDCIPIDQQQCELVDSDLSDWSECSSDNEQSELQTKREDTLVESKSEDRYKAYLVKSGLKPPQKEPHYRPFNSSESRQWLIDNVQHTWWQENQSSTDARGVNVESNFCNLWNQCVMNTSSTYRQQTPISTTSEYCLLREILWMFQVPCNCKFFSVKNGSVMVNNNVSISSVTQDGLRTFLQDFTPYMEKLMELQAFIKSVYDCQSQMQAPYTYECYASGLKQLLEPFFTKLSHKEEQIKAQNIGEISTILQLRHEFNRDFRYLDLLHSIHSFSVLNYKKYPAHICTAHLLAGLIHEFHIATSPEAANLAASLFLAAMKTFCQIIDIWWTEGRLDDWHNEFLVEKKSAESEEVELRLYEKCKEKSFFVPQSVSNIIQQDAFLALLKEHSLQAGCTLNLLYQINKINELKNSSNFKDTLYDSFIELFKKEVLNYNYKHETSASSTDREDNISFNENNIEKNPIAISTNATEQFWSFQDDFLMMAFKCASLDVPSEPNRIEERKDNLSTALNEVNISSIFNELNGSSGILLPLEEIIIKTFSSILKTRISFTNSFVTDLYKYEFEISRHLQNMRKVLLLEASDLMDIFYIQLFKQIESGKVWANPFLLTAQLDDILSSKILKISSLFRVDFMSAFKCETTKVIDAIGQLNIIYDVNKQLQHIISEKNVSDYNNVFRFLLKVKWGLWALENLQFQRKYRTRPPYVELRMIDLLMRRLEQLRFWILYAMQCIHFYLMTQVLQSMGIQLDEKILSCTTLSEMRSVHESFIQTVCSHCFLKPSNNNMKVGIEQLLNLIFVLRYEWASCVTEIEIGDDTDDLEHDQSNECVLSSQIDAIESTYIRCHAYLASVLNNEVYAKQNSHLAGLSAAFNNSMPY